MQRKILKIFLLASFCAVFSDVWAVNSVNRALKLAKAVYKKSSNVTPSSTTGSSTSIMDCFYNTPSLGFLHIELMIGNKTYILANQPGSGYQGDGTEVSGVTNVLNDLKWSDWQSGVYLTLNSANNTVSINAKNLQNKAIASGTLPGLTSLPAKVKWAGSECPPVSLNSNVTVLYQTIPTISTTDPLTSFSLWAVDTTNTKGLIQVDFTSNNNQLLQALNTALQTKDVTLHYQITPLPADSSNAYAVSVQGYDNSGNPIASLNYQENQGTHGQKLGYGYFRYSFSPGGANQLGFPNGTDLTAEELSDFYIKIKLVKPMVNNTNLAEKKLDSVKNLLGITSSSSVKANLALNSDGSMPRFNINFPGMNTGYAFVENPWPGTGIQTALDNTSSANFDWQTVAAKMNSNYSGSNGVDMILAAFDRNGNYITTPWTNTPTYMALFIFDAKTKSQLPGSPLIFPAVNYTGGDGKTPPTITQVSQSNHIEMGAPGIPDGVSITTYPFVLSIPAVQGPQALGTIKTTAALTSLFLWAVDTINTKGLIQVDFTANNDQYLNALNTALQTTDVTLHYRITPLPEGSSNAYAVSVQGYDNSGNPIASLNYQENQGTYGQTLDYGYFRYSFSPGGANQLGLPDGGSDFNAEQLSNFWLKITKLPTSSTTQEAEDFTSSGVL
jgi:hypothetical protein